MRVCVRVNVKIDTDKKKKKNCYFHMFIFYLRRETLLVSTVTTLPNPLYSYLSFFCILHSSSIPHSHLVCGHVYNVYFSVGYFTRNNLDICTHRHPINLPALKFFISEKKQTYLNPC